MPLDGILRHYPGGIVVHGPDFERPDENAIEIIRGASTATLTTILRRLDIHSVWMPLKPFRTGMKVTGPALTIRCVPGREDFEASVHEPGALFPRHPDDAIDAVQPGDVVVMDGRGSVTGAIIGDLLSTRLKIKAAAGLVCDMAVRDSPRLTEAGVPIFSRGAVSPGSRMFCPDYNIPVGCAGVLVLPGDVVSGDDDGVVLIPRQIVGEVVREILIFEDREEYIRLQLGKGASLRGLYPMGPEWEARFQDWRKSDKRITSSGGAQS